MKKLLVAVIAVVVLAVSALDGQEPARAGAVQRQEAEARAAVERLDEAARVRELFQEQLRTSQERRADEEARARAVLEELVAAQARNAEQARKAEQESRAKAEEQARAARAKAEEQAPARATVNPPAPASQLVNIRIDVTLVRTGAQPSRKTVSVTVADGGRGSVRSFQANFPTPPGGDQGPDMINVDARPRVVRDGRVHTAIVIEYRRGLTLAFDPLLDSGKPLMVSQAPDPGSDAITTVEVTATVLK